MYIAILEPYPEIDTKYLKYLAEKGHVLIPFGDKYNKNKIDAIIIRSKVQVDKYLLDQYPTLSYVFRVGVGLDNIDINILEERNIILKNTPGANAQSVAELCVWAMISLLRNTYKKFSTIEDRFDFMGTELNNKTIGIVGFGNIGRILYKIITIFGTNNFIIYDPFINPNDFNETNISFVNDKKQLFELSDIISFHIPLLTETKNFLSGNDFYLLKKNVKIINSSRGGIINEIDLINFLKINPESGAFLDTWEDEPKNPKKELLDLGNCIITPHIGAMTEESNKKMHFFTL